MPIRAWASTGDLDWILLILITGMQVFIAHVYALTGYRYDLCLISDMLDTK
jgi:hypothetical protein